MFQGSCTQVCFNRVGDLAMSGADGQVKITKKGETADSQILQAMSSVDHLTWSQDDQLIIAITKQSLEIWDRSNRKLVNYKTNRRIAGVHMDEKHQGTLIEESGNLYGFTISEDNSSHNNHDSLEIKWIVPSEKYQGEMIFLGESFDDSTMFNTPWQEDSSVKSCSSCGRSFILLFRRRHHCRKW